MYPHGKNILSLPALDKELVEHVSMVDLHYTALTNRYLAIYGDMIDASRSGDSDQWLEYIVKSSGVKDGMHLIDAGCGVCGPTRFFAAKFNIQIDAITASRVHHSIAEEKNKSAGFHSKIKVTCGDFHLLSNFYPNNSCDLVYFLESFCQSYDYHRVIDEACKVLKQGGHVYMKDWFLADRLRLKDPQKYETVKKRINEFYVFNFKEGVCEINSIADYMNKNGFRVEFARTPAYEQGDYTLTSIFHGNNEDFGPNNQFQSNDLGGDITDVFDVIEIFELKAMKL